MEGEEVGSVESRNRREGESRGRMGGKEWSEEEEGQRKTVGEWE